MAGIDKIFLKDYVEYEHLKQFCFKYNQDFYKLHNYYLSCGLYDGITQETFSDGDEHPVSNFSTDADLFIIQHLTFSDMRGMPNVVDRFKQQYSSGKHSFHLIREHNSIYDTYQIDRSGCKVKLVSKTNNKILKHIKREHWECVNVIVISSHLKHHLEEWYKYTNIGFDYFNKIIYNFNLGCKFYRENDDTINQHLRNVSMKQVYNYITKTRLKRGTEILVCCNNYTYNKEGFIEDISSHADYKFVVI